MYNITTLRRSVSKCLINQPNPGMDGKGTQPTSILSAFRAKGHENCHCLELFWANNTLYLFTLEVTSSKSLATVICVDYRRILTIRVQLKISDKKRLNYCNIFASYWIHTALLDCNQCD